MTTLTPSSLFTPADLISRYTRTDALCDGELIAAPLDLTREAGIAVPVALTRAAWYQYIEPEYLTEMPNQDLIGRLWDLLWMLRMAAMRSRGSSVIIFRVAFEVLQKRTMGMTVTHYRSTETVQLKSVCGPGDDWEPVITVMLPWED